MKCNTLDKIHDPSTFVASFRIPSVRYGHNNYCDKLDVDEFSNLRQTARNLKLINIIVRLSFLTTTNLNHMREMFLFVCSKMAD